MQANASYSNPFQGGAGGGLKLNPQRISQAWQINNSCQHLLDTIMQQGFHAINVLLPELARAQTDGRRYPKK